MRVGEAVNLNREQLKIKPETKDLEISIIGKGQRPRTVYFSERAIFWLRNYLEKEKTKRKLFLLIIVEKNRVQD